MARFLSRLAQLALTGLKHNGPPAEMPRPPVGPDPSLQGGFSRGFSSGFNRIR